MSSSAASATTKMSRNVNEARLRVKALYRHAMRHAPAIAKGYELEVPAATLKVAIRNKFAVHEGASEPGVIDVLCYKGELELQETLMMWKTKAHVQKYVDALGVGDQPQFVEEFYRGYTVDEWTWPPAGEQRADASAVFGKV